MKLTVRDAAALLSIAESSLERAIKGGALRAYKMNQQYWLHRSELLEWATAERIAVPPEMLDDAGDASVADALERGGVQHDVPGKTAAEVLRAILDALPVPDGTDKDVLLEMLVARQAECTTAVGNGIAFPHVRSPMVLDIDEPIMALAYLAQPVDFDAIDGQPVNVVFAFVTPTIRTHHRILSRLAYVVRDERFEALRDAKAGADEIVALARRIEGELDRRKGAA